MRKHIDKIIDDSIATAAENGIIGFMSQKELTVTSVNALKNIELYDVTGKLIFSQNFEDSLISSFNRKLTVENGVYILNVESKDGSKKSIKLLSY